MIQNVFLEKKLKNVKNINLKIMSVKHVLKITTHFLLLIIAKKLMKLNTVKIIKMKVNVKNVKKDII